MIRHISGAAAATIVALTLGTDVVDAQVTTAPPLGPTPTLTLPTVDTAHLANGLTILTSRNAEVPLVSAVLMIHGGARTAESPAGLATFTANMLGEGADGLDAFEFADSVDALGGSLGAGASWDYTTLRASAPKTTFPHLMKFMALELAQPNFNSADIARERSARQAQLLAAKDSPGAVAVRVFMRNVFPEGNPYHYNQSGDSATTAALDSAMVRNFWNRQADPEHATLIVTGDVTPAEAYEWASEALGYWTRPANPARVPPPSAAVPAPRPSTHIILVDKPGAAQSVIFIGSPGVARSAPDYPALQVMNTILGGSFSSRLNQILREQRGYTYGAGSYFVFSQVTGPFMAQSQVRTNVTDSSLAIFFRQFERIRDTQVSNEDLERARNLLVLGSLGDYETAGQVAGAIANGVIFDMPLQQTATELDAIGAVTAAQVQAVAQKYIDPDNLTVVIVGDLAKIRPGIEALNLGPIEVQEY